MMSMQHADAQIIRAVEGEPEPLRVKTVPEMSRLNRIYSRSTLVRRSRIEHARIEFQ
jgi:hypothetical protein